MLQIKQCDLSRGRYTCVFLGATTAFTGAAVREISSRRTPSWLVSGNSSVAARTLLGYGTYELGTELPF
jgi:hypothetical protein